MHLKKINKQNASNYWLFWVTAILARAKSSGYVELEAVRPANEPARKRLKGVELDKHVYITKLIIKNDF